MSLVVWTDDGVSKFRWTMPAVPRVGENLMLGMVQYVVTGVVWEMHEHEVTRKALGLGPIMRSEWEPRLKIKRVT